ncbi:hypothetical protein BBP40_009392 [Aspergillus hancockii]|nr:hypothetical protein BBP40_009392 [Aspergillus hancockii]
MASVLPKNGKEPRSYLGVAAHGFPNYFMFLGRNSPLANFLNRWQKEDIRTYEAKPKAVDDFMEQKDLFMKDTIWEKALAVQRFEDFDISYAVQNRFAYLGNGLSQTHFRLGGDLTYYLRDEDKGESIFPELVSTDNVKDSANTLTVQEATQLSL